MDATKVSDCCTDKFQSLSKYFHELTFADLDYLDEEDLVQTAVPEDRLLMRVFVSKCIRPYFEVSAGNPSKLAQKDTLVVKDGTLNLQHKVMSAWYRTDRDNETHLIHMSILHEKIRTEISPYEVKILDLSYNHLHNVDLPHVLKCISALTNITVLDMSYNNLVSDGDNKGIHEILSHKPLRYVKVCVNAIASDLAKSFLNTLSDADLGKLIWIPKVWLASKGWCSVITEKGKLDVIERTHCQFYSEFQSE